MKKSIFLIILTIVANVTFAFDWKPQSNEALRSDMITFAREFAQEAKGTKAGRKLKRFVRRQERLARKDDYIWMAETHKMVNTLKEMYPPQVDDGQFEAMMRRNTLRLLDYPLHFDNFAKTSPEGIEAFNAVTNTYLNDARQQVLQWLEQPKPEAGQLDITLVYNMGVLIRSSEKTIAIDIRWDGTKDEAQKIAENIDMLFLTHPHSDHYSPIMLQAAINAGKPVVLPCQLKDWQNDKAIIIDKELTAPKELNFVRICSLRGDQGENIPNNVYLIEFNGWRILHQGDNEVWDIQEKLSEMPRADVIIAPSWNGIQNLLTPALKAPRYRGQGEPLFLPLHNNEMRHTVDHRESYWELFNRKDRMGNTTYHYPPFVLLDNGDNYIYER